MAKIKFGAIVTDVRGAIDSVVYSRSKYGAYARKKVTPVNPNTAAQSLARAIFGSASSLFKSLGAATIESWNSVAGEYSRTNVFGDNLPLSGQTLFTKLKSQLVNLQVFVNPIAISPLTVLAPFVDSVVFDQALEEITLVQLSATDATDVIAIYATSPFSAGKSFVGRSQLRLLAVKAQGTVLQDLDLTTPYINLFGTPFNINNVGLKVRFVIKRVSTINGQSSAELNLDTLIV